MRISDWSSDVCSSDLPRILDRGAIRIIDLRPAGDPRLHHVALGIIRQPGFEILDELRPFGARADEAHLALEHAPRLRQLVDPELADAPPKDRTSTRLYSCH